MAEKRRLHDEAYELEQEKAYKKLNPDESNALINLSLPISPLKKKQSKNSLRTSAKNLKTFALKKSYEIRNKTIGVKKSLDK